MKIRFFKYGKYPRENEVISVCKEVERINDNLFLCPDEPYPNIPDQDLVFVILKVGEVYFVEGSYRRQTTKRPDFESVATDFALNYTENIRKKIEAGEFITLMNIKVFESLGLDTASLHEARQARETRLEAKREDERIKKADAQAERQRHEVERLEGVKAKFAAGEPIQTEDFLTLVKMAGLAIPIQTIGTLRRSVSEVYLSGALRVSRRKGQRWPDTIGCRKIIRQYREIISKK